MNVKGTVFFFFFFFFKPSFSVFGYSCLGGWGWSERQKQTKKSLLVTVGMGREKPPG